MPTPMSAYAQVAAEYGNVDPNDDHAVDRFFAEDLHRLDEAVRHQILDHLLAEESSVGNEESDIPQVSPAQRQRESANFGAPADAAKDSFVGSPLSNYYEQIRTRSRGMNLGRIAELRAQEPLSHQRLAHLQAIGFLAAALAREAIALQRLTPDPQGLSKILQRRISPGWRIETARTNQITLLIELFQRRLSQLVQQEIEQTKSDNDPFEDIFAGTYFFNSEDS